MADNLKNLVPKLAKRGPHRVLVGDLDYAGIPGRVYVPAEGKSIPGVAFGHDWRLGIDAYHAALRHLASWGIAVAAPDTEKGFVANHRGFASDLETALQILAGVRLGNGNVVVQPNNLYLAGHGMGAAAAILAASGRTAKENIKGYHHTPTVSGVMAVFPSDSAPSAYEAAKNISAPGLVLAPGSSHNIPKGNAERIAANWKGEVTYRKLNRLTSDSFHEKQWRNLLLGGARPSSSNQELIRALITGFILGDSDSSYRAFRDPHAGLVHTDVASQLDLRRDLPENADPIQRMEYRGYDSAGIAVVGPEKLALQKIG